MAFAICGGTGFRASRWPAIRICPECKKARANDGAHSRLQIARLSGERLARPRTLATGPCAAGERDYRRLPRRQPGCRFAPYQLRGLGSLRLRALEVATPTTLIQSVRLARSPLLATR